MHTIGYRLRELRKSHNLTLKQLAEILGVSHGNISDWESERSKPSADAIVNISKYFNVSADWLLTGKDNANKSNDVENATSTDNELPIPKFDPVVEEALKDDPELQEFWGEMIEREDLRLLFKKSRPLKPRTVRQIIAWIKTIEDEESRED